MRYTIRKRFVSGLLNGIKIDDTSPVPFEVGVRYKSATGSDYVVLSCEAVS